MKCRADPPSLSNASNTRAVGASPRILLHSFILDVIDVSFDLPSGIASSMPNALHDIADAVMLFTAPGANGNERRSD